MVMIKAFKAIRASNEYAHEVAELPYDTMDSLEARKIAEENKNSYIRIDKAEVDLPLGTDIYSEEVYKKAAENLNDFLEKGLLVEESEESLYIYREIMENIIQIGIIACVSVEEAINNIIKKHEHTKPDKVLDRKKHIEYCKAHTGTILLTYENQENIDKIIEKEIKEEALYDFVSNDKVRHTVWKISDKNKEDIINEFKKVDYLYIADGHHRSKAAQEYAIENRENGYEKHKEFEYYLAMIVPKNNLHIMDYNRVIKDLNNYEEEEFLKLLKVKFNYEKVEKPYKPTEKYHYGMYLDKTWYKLSFKNINMLKTPLEKLDVSVLHDYLITPILEILDPKKDPRIDFIGGIKGLKEIENRVGEDMKIGFSLYPTKLEEVFEIANNNEVMPPKSTWFEPKVRCGLFLHKL